VLCSIIIDNRDFKVVVYSELYDKHIGCLSLF